MPAQNVHLKEQTNVTPAEFDEALTTLSKGLIDLLENDEFVADIYNLMGPCGEEYMGDNWLNRVVQGDDGPSTVHEEMNKAIEKYTPGLASGEDYVTKLMSKFKVNGIQYAPALYIPNFENAKSSEILPLAAPGVGYENPDETDENDEDEVVYAWKLVDNALTRINVKKQMAESSTPIVIVGNMSIEQINNPCGGSGNPGSGSGGGSSGSSQGEDERKGPAIQSSDVDAIGVSVTKLRLLNRFEGNGKSDINYRVTVINNPNFAGSALEGDNGKPGGFNIARVKKSQIDNQEVVSVDEPFLSFGSSFPFIALTVFEYDWYTPHKWNPPFALVNGVVISHEFRSVFSNEVYYRGFSSFIDVNNHAPTYNYFGVSGTSIGQCNGCFGNVNCLDPDPVGCSSHYIELTRD